MTKHLTPGEFGHRAPVKGPSTELFRGWAEFADGTRTESEELMTGPVLLKWILSRKAEGATRVGRHTTGLKEEASC